MQELLETGRALRLARYPGAAAFFLAGSLIRGEGTEHSDLDIVVVFDRLDCAYRESFLFNGYPVESFVHDPQTLEYFFTQIDRQAAYAALPRMVAEGIALPESSEMSRSLKKRAEDILASGPPPLDTDAERRLRYEVSDLVDDLRSAPHAERVATACRLFDRLANYHLRVRGLWSGTGKWLHRALKRGDAPLAERYLRSFEELFRTGDPGSVILLADELLRPHGGLLFDGYRADAPQGWRVAGAP
jgi:hypothetical protein